MRSKWRNLETRQKDGERNVKRDFFMVKRQTLELPLQYLACTLHIPIIIPA